MSEIHTTKQVSQGIVTVTRELSEEGNWTVRQWGKGQYSHRLVSCHCFLERNDAVMFARRLQREQNAGDVVVR